MLHELATEGRSGAALLRVAFEQPSQHGGERARGDKRLAAQILGIHPRTITRYLETQAPKEPVEIGPPAVDGEPPKIDLKDETGEVEV